MESKFLTVDTQTSLFLPNTREAIIMPVGDLQYGARGCDIERFRRHIAWGMERGAYFLGMGDYIDVASPSNRARFDNADLYDSMKDAMDAAVGQQERRLRAILEPTRGRWLGLLEGHHTWVYQTGRTTDQNLCDFLEAPFLGRCALTILRMSDGQRNIDCKIWAHHGEGAAATLAGPIAKLERVSNHFDADIYLMGHYHRKVATKIPRLTFSVGRTGRVYRGHSNRILAVTGGFLSGYPEATRFQGRAEGTYIEHRMLPPTAEGGIVIYARTRRPHRGRAALDLDVSL